MPTPIHTPDELRDLLVTLLVGAAGGTEAKWRKAIGPVEKLSLASNVRCNWRITPAGTAMEREMVSKAVEIVRNEHPYVAG